MKHNKLYSALLALFLMCTISAHALNLPKRTIGSTEFYCYKVQAKETIFGISKKLNITQDDLKKYNPSIVNGLKKDYILLIPVNLVSPEKEDNATVSQSDKFTHIVAKGETLYGLSKTYNVTQDEIIALNPGANDGLKVGQSLIIPQPETKEDVAENDSKSEVNNEIIYHTIAKGETLYNLSKRYDTSIEKILSLNPGVSPTNFKINDVIRIAQNTIKSEMQEMMVTTMEPYVVQKGDNYKKIAKAQGVDVEDLVAANPNTSKVKPGETIQIPVEKLDSVKVVVSEGTEHELRDNGSEKIKEIYDSIHNNVDKEVNVALLLPYMLNEKTQSKQARLYTEFYKGFLLAVKDVNKSCSNKINIHTYDTQNSIAELKSILNKPELKSMDLIFAPDGIEQINEIAQFCNENKIYMVNSFSLKNEGYENNPYIFQINIPQSYMHADVCDWLDTEFLGYEVVFIHKTGGNKKDLVEDLKQHLRQKGQAIHYVDYQSALTFDMLAEKVEPAKKYLFIPTAGTKSAMTQLIPAVKKLKEDRIDIEVSVLGYPEWVTYLEDWVEDLQATDAYFYTRFYADATGYKNEKFESEYKEWYGEKLVNAAPRFGLLGYDTGMFFLKTLCWNGKDFNNIKQEYNGLQSSFSFERINNWSGFVNKSVYFVHCTPDGRIETIVR